MVRTYCPVIVAAIATNAMGVAVLASFAADVAVAFASSEEEAAADPFLAVVTVSDDIAVVIAVAVTYQTVAIAS